jgi:hypothetical protein
LKHIRTFANRLRLRLKDLGLTDPDSVQRLDRARQEMRDILKKNKVTGAAAKLAIEQALDAAADYQMEALRAEQVVQSHALAREQLRDLIRHVEQLSDAIAKLPPLSKGQINRLIDDKDWTEFDAEIFAQLFQELLDMLSQLSPQRLANDVGVEIRENLHLRHDPVVAWTERTAPPAVTELWDCMPAETRSAVEAELRAWTPPTRGQVTAFLDHLRTLLEKKWPGGRPGRRRALVSAYLKRIAAIWQRLDLHVGLARGGSRVKEAESSVQRFARIALAAVGDNSTVSARQIENLKKNRRAKVQ